MICISTPVNDQSNSHVYIHIVTFIAYTCLLTLCPYLHLVVYLRLNITVLVVCILAPSHILTPSCGSSPTFVCLCICVLLCLAFVCPSVTSTCVVLLTFLHVFITLLVSLPCLLPFQIHTASVFALLVATKFLQLNIAVFLAYLHTFLFTYLFIPHLYLQR